MNIHLFHEWSDWSAPHVDAWAGEGKLIQSRFCICCEKVQIERVSMPMFCRPSLSDVNNGIAKLKEVQG